MSTFNDREAGFESKFAHDDAQEFKATARRTRLLGIARCHGSTVCHTRLWLANIAPSNTHRSGRPAVSTCTRVTPAGIC